MTHREFKRLLAAPEKLSGGFLFFGEEDFVKTRYADELMKAVVGDDPFVTNVIEGTDTSPDEVGDALVSMSMFGARRFVRVDHADVGRWKKKKKKSDGEDDGGDGLLDEYLAVFASVKDDDSLVYCIIVNSGEADFGDVAKNKPSALYKKLTEYLTPVYFGSAGGTELSKWVERHILAASLRAEYGAADALVSICGQDLFTLKSECEKLVAYAKAHGADTVTADMVRFVASPNIIEEAFELSNAIITGDRKKALHALYGAKLRREEPIAVMGGISKTVADMLAAAVYAKNGVPVGEIAKRLKIHEYRATLYLRATGSDVERVEATLRKCLAADRQLKSTTHDFTPIERLICST